MIHYTLDITLDSSLQFVVMSRGWSVVLYILAINSFGPYLTRATEAVVITANAGDPFVLEFDIAIGTDANSEDSYFTKNGEKLQTGQNGKLMFQQLTLTDSGKYHFIVNSKRSSNKTHGPVILKGLLSS